MTGRDSHALAARLLDLEGAVALGRQLAASSPALSKPTPTPERVRTEGAFRAFNTLLHREGIRSALAYLVSLTDYRFISIFRFDGSRATSAVHVDREELSAVQAPEVPDTATYCCFVRDREGAFVTVHALLDPRAEGHPARNDIPAYCGIPIMDPEGGLIGTLCHYDVVPRDTEQLDLELLLQCASALAQSGLVPPYPR